MSARRWSMKLTNVSEYKCTWFYWHHSFDKAHTVLEGEMGGVMVWGWIIKDCYLIFLPHDFMPWEEEWEVAKSEKQVKGEVDWRIKEREILKRNMCSYNENTRCTISHIYLIKYSTCFGQVHCPSSGVSQNCIHAIGICHSSSLGFC